MYLHIENSNHSDPLAFQPIESFARLSFHTQMKQSLQMYPPKRESVVNGSVKLHISRRFTMPGRKSTLDKTVLTQNKIPCSFKVLVFVLIIVHLQLHCG